MGPGGGGKLDVGQRRLFHCFIFFNGSAIPCQDSLLLSTYGSVVAPFSYNTFLYSFVFNRDNIIVNLIVKTWHIDLKHSDRQGSRKHGMNPGLRFINTLYGT